VRQGRELVLLRPADAQLGAKPLGGFAHRDVVVGVGQAVQGHRVEHLGRAEPVAGPGLGQQVRRLGHRLHAARHRHVDLTQPDQLGSQRDRVQAG
jgi:hypothetical protein